MIKVLLVASSAPQPETLVASLRNLQGEDVQIRLAGFCASDELPGSPFLADAHSFSEQNHGKGFAAAAKKVSAPRRTWLYANKDAWLKQHARKADVLVALDAQAVYTVWQLAQANRVAHACFGTAAAVRALADRRADPRHYARAARLDALPNPARAARGARRKVVRLPRTVAARAIGPRVLRTGVGARAWRLAVSAPGLPEPVRFKLARRVGNGMAKANRPAGAALALHSAAQRTGSLRRRADLLTDAARIELSSGRVPGRLTEAVTAELEYADGQLGRGKTKAAARSAIAAMTLAFHRVLHFDRTTSPLTDDPAKYLAPLHRSATLKALSVGAGRTVPAAAATSDRPLRLLFVTRANANFLTEISDHYEAHPGVEVRFLDLKTDPALDKLATDLTRLADHRLGGDAEFARQAEELLRPHLDWADTVFVDWCVGPAALLTAVDPGSTRVVVRLHSFETFSYWPFLVDFSRVDDLVFVGAHLRDLTTAVVPQLRSAEAPRLHVIHNAMDLTRFVRPKAPDARFTLALTGISAVAKDPRWAIEVLRILRAKDSRYRLFLLGEDVDAKLSAAARAYAVQYRKDVAELEPDGAVVRLGQLDDVPAALTEVGVILSASVRESFHCGFVEGAASGAVPVARDWPFFAGKENSARTLFPADWVTSTPEEAAERILKVTATQEGWIEACQAASEHALTAWDWPVVREDFDRLLLSTEGGESPAVRAQHADRA
ncbi:hypothetical protein [Streptomyces sp. NPDC051219]|uniref:hypothetical protein n=1 Tax=Streptomyces sp. NPDC051219 TaxID=3155283 RepID=UPI0034396C35